MLSKSDILGAKDFKLRAVEVPQWGGSVMIKTMSAAEKGCFEQKMSSGNPDLSTVMAEYASLIICDEEGKKLFSSADITKLSEKSAAALELIFEAGRDLNNFSQDDLEEIAGN